MYPKEAARLCLRLYAARGRTDILEKNPFQRRRLPWKDSLQGQEDYGITKRNSVSFYLIEWENITVNTWEPEKHLDSDDGRAAIASRELQSSQVPADDLISIKFRNLTALPF